jgi:hypothetical protein
MITSAGNGLENRNSGETARMLAKAHQLYSKSKKPIVDFIN